MATIKVKFQKDRETKGAVRFQEVDSKGKAPELADTTIGTLYLRKSALNGDVPESVSVEIKYS